MFKFVNAQMIPYEPDKFLSFDDVLLEPQFSMLKSRNDLQISLETKFTEGMRVATPIVAASMDTICGPEMCKALHKCGGVGILHRNYKDYNQRYNDILEISNDTNMPPVFSVGIGSDEFDLVGDILNKTNHAVVNVDVAHGHQEQVLDFIRKLRTSFTNQIQIIGGSVCTPQGAADLVNAGVSALRVGIGVGSHCSTRIMTGHGIPQLSAIYLIRKTLTGLKSNVALIADGGIRNSGDIVKALAAGADTVMIGHIFAGTDETPGEIYFKNNGEYHECDHIDDYYISELYKKYRGQSSQDYLNDIGKFDVIPEGVHSFVQCKGPVSKIVEILLGGLRSGMTYSGVDSIKKLFNNTRFIEISHNSYIEGLTYGAS